LDNLTHTLFAATLGRTPLGRAGRGTTLALIIASNIPDIDIVAAARGGAEYLHWHRGPTHGPLAIVGLGLPAAALAWGWIRFRERKLSAMGRQGASFWHLAALSMFGVALHLLMDFPTSYGTRSLSPFDWHWFALDWMPIIDIYLLAALAFGLLVGGRLPETRQRAAAAVLILMAANYALRGVAHHQAVALAPRALGLTAPRCSAADPPLLSPERWPRDEAAVPAAAGCIVTIAAIPTFVSPAIWRVITQYPNGYELHDLNLMDALFMGPAAEAPRVRLYFPNEWTPAVTTAAGTRLAQIYLGFARFPAARSVVEPDGDTVVRWNDMRFVGGFLRLDQPSRRDAFTAQFRLDPAGRIVEERFGP
jgi:inner membrane protein